MVVGSFATIKRLAKKFPPNGIRRSCQNYSSRRARGVTRGWIIQKISSSSLAQLVISLRRELSGWKKLLIRRTALQISRPSLLDVSFARLPPDNFQRRFRSPGVVGDRIFDDR